MDDGSFIDFTGRDAVADPMTDLLRKGARELLQAAVEAERDAFLAGFSERRTSDGRAAVVRSGHHPERAVQIRIGPVTVKVPKVRAKDRKPVTFRSALVPHAVHHHRAKLVMSTDPSAESDFKDMAPEGVAVYVTRLKTADHTTNETLSRHIEHMAVAASRIQPEAEPDIVSYSCTSGSIVIGEDRVMAETTDQLQGFGRIFSHPGTSLLPG